MFVTKRNGTREQMNVDKIRARVAAAANCPSLLDHVDVEAVTQRVVDGLYNGATTIELDGLAARMAAAKAIQHPEYMDLAGRIAISAHHKVTPDTFSEAVETLGAGILSNELVATVATYKAELNAMIVMDRDFMLDYFGFSTLIRAYLMRDKEKKIIERPQYMWMRVSVGIHGNNLEQVKKTYDLLSKLYFTHATPTLFNAGTANPQLSSCFLLTMQDDSIDGIYATVTQCAKISKYAGGIGLSVHNIRATGSYIAGTNGTSNGLVPMLRVFNATARYVDQGGGKRKGSFAIYVEPWHADIQAFLDLKKNQGKEEARARDLFYALWIPSLFMRRVERDETWSLFCPREAPGLADCHSEEFDALYAQYEHEGRAKRTLRARKLFQMIIQSQVETGTPYMLYKDACNNKSNQRHLGTIKSSNLCTEIVQYTSRDEVAVCNLASVALPKFAGEGQEYDFAHLGAVVEVMVHNLNLIIDKNFYPVKEAQTSNYRHRPIGCGVQGLSDVFMKFGYPFESKEAKDLNRKIFETIYYHAMKASVELAERDGPYESFQGSPLSEGKFQFDLWEVQPIPGRYDWEALRRRVLVSGARNSLLVAPMPTASTSQILGNTEGIDPLTANIYHRRTIAGEFTVVNRYMVEALGNKWTPDVQNLIIHDRGSISRVPSVDKRTKEIFKTVWEIKQKAVLDMAAQRGPYICQSQSMNVHFENPTEQRLAAMHMYAFKAGLKTGMYYLRSRAANDPIQFTVDEQKVAETLQAKDDEEEECLMCGS